MIVVLNAFNIVCNVPQTIAWISHSKTHDGIRDIGAKASRERSHGDYNGNARDGDNLFVKAKYADVPWMNAATRMRTTYAQIQREADMHILR